MLLHGCWPAGRCDRSNEDDLAAECKGHDGLYRAFLSHRLGDVGAEDIWLENAHGMLA